MNRTLVPMLGAERCLGHLLRTVPRAAGCAPWGPSHSVGERAIALAGIGDKRLY
jgi:hypothetical protein